MMVKRVLASFFVVHLLAFYAYGQDKSQKAEWLSGVVVAYDVIKPDLPCYGACDGSLIVRLKTDQQETARYIRIDFKFRESQDFPKKLIASKNLWRFRLIRTSTLDEPIYDYIVQNATAYSEEKKYPIWKLVRGAEDEELPFGQRLPSYSLTRNGFKPISSR